MPDQPDEPTQPVSSSQPPPPGSPPQSPYGSAPQSPYGSAPQSPYGSPYGSAQPGQGQPPGSPLPTAQGPGYPAPPPRKGFFGALLDLSFTSYVTPMVVGVIYVLGMVGLALGLLVMVVAGFVDSFASGLLALVLGPLVALIYLVLWRMLLEFYVAVTRMAEDIHRRLPQG